MAEVAATCSTIMGAFPDNGMSRVGVMWLQYNYFIGSSGS